LKAARTAFTWQRVSERTATCAWLTATGDEKLIFDEDRDEVWDEAMKRRTQDL